MKPHIHCIYSITHKASNKIYLGITTRADIIAAETIEKLRQLTHSCSELQYLYDHAPGIDIVVDPPMTEHRANTEWVKRAGELHKAERLLNYRAGKSTLKVTRRPTTRFSAAKYRNL